MSDKDKARMAAGKFDHAPMFQAHPWHGVSPGDECPHNLRAFIEIVPTDTVKYEVDKATGMLKVDRPQRFSSVCPTLYGFVPQTYCGPEVARLCEMASGRSGIKGDGDPLDICVLSERSITSGNLLLMARPVGGLRMIDHDEADDKIIAVLDADAAYGRITDIDGIPPGLVERLKHYFLSYKQLPDEPDRNVVIDEVYDRDHALRVIEASLADYNAKFGNPKERKV